MSLPLLLHLFFSSDGSDFYTIQSIAAREVKGNQKQHWWLSSFMLLICSSTTTVQDDEGCWNQLLTLWLEAICKSWFLIFIARRDFIFLKTTKYAFSLFFFVCYREALQPAEIICCFSALALIKDNYPTPKSSLYLFDYFSFSVPTTPLKPSLSLSVVVTWNWFVSQHPSRQISTLSRSRCVFYWLLLTMVETPDTLPKHKKMAVVKERSRLWLTYRL